MLKCFIRLPSGVPASLRMNCKRPPPLGRSTEIRWLVKKNGQRIMVNGITIALRDQTGQLAGFGKIFINNSESKDAEENTRAQEAGEPRYIISTHSDITSRLQMQRELESANGRLKRMATELERSNEELEEFARIASHDLSAPITTTRWLADLLASRHSSQLDEEGRKCVKQISTSLERMADLVEAVLTHARVGTSAIGANEACDADAALAGATENLRRDIATSGAVIEHEPLPKLPIQPQPLTQLFQNLLSNAIKYRRPDSAPHVHVSASRDGHRWLIRVADNGIGIEPEWHERIFLPLQRRHGMQVAGSGIGLATCKKIVTRAGGHIWVESEAGSGSTFYFTIPAFE